MNTFILQNCLTLQIFIKMALFLLWNLILKNNIKKKHVFIRQFIVLLRRFSLYMPFFESYRGCIIWKLCTIALNVFLASRFLQLFVLKLLYWLLICLDGRNLITEKPCIGKLKYLQICKNRHSPFLKTQ